MGLGYLQPLDKKQSNNMNESKFFEREAKYMINMMRSPNAPENYADEKMAGITNEAMRSKLRIARDKGRHGWWNSEQCSIEDLKKMLLEQIKKGDMIDVMNFAGMIFIREKGEPAQQEIKYPAKYICHWPSGSTPCCEAHATLLSNLARHMCCSAPIEIITEPMECANCVNEAFHEGERPSPPTYGE